MARTPAPGPMAAGPNLDRYVSTTPLHELGALFHGANGKMYRYVQFLDAVAYLAGHVCTRATGGADLWKVTNDRAGGSNVTGHEVIGVLHGTVNVPTQDQYGWIQIAGECAPLGTYSAGDYLIPHATADGTFVVSGYSAAKADFNIAGKANTSALVKLVGLV